MKDINKVLAQVDVYMPQFDTECGYVWSNESAIARYIERGRQEFIEYWNEYVKELYE